MRYPISQTLLSLCLFLASAHYSFGCDLYAGWTRVSIDDTSRHKTISCMLYYPAESSGFNTKFISDSSLTARDILVVAHGKQIGASFYHSYCLQNNGLIDFRDFVLVPDSDTSSTSTTNDFALDIQRCLEWLDGESNKRTSPFYHTLSHSLVLNGFDFGATAICSVALQYTKTGTWNLKGVSLISPQLNSETLNFANKVFGIPVQYICAENDCIYPPALHAQQLYNATTTQCKAVITMLGGTHCQFSDTIPFSCSASEQSCSPATLSLTRQLSLTKQSLVAFWESCFNDYSHIEWLVRDSAYVRIRTSIVSRSAIQPIVSKQNLCKSDTFKVYCPIKLKSISWEVYDVSGKSLLKTFQGQGFSYRSDTSFSYKMKVSDTCIDDSYSTLNYIQVGESSHAISEVSLCEGTSISIGLTQPSSRFQQFHWSTSELKPSISVRDTGEYVLDYFDSDFCAWQQVKYMVHYSAPERFSLRKTGDTVICERGAGIELSFADAQLYHCTWSTGDSSKSISISSAGIHKVWCSRRSYSFPCIELSDTVTFNITVLPNPIPSISFHNGVLHSSQASDYLWILNGIPIDNALLQDYSPTASGYYRVYVINDRNSGCAALSDSILVDLPSSVNDSNSGHDTFVRSNLNGLELVNAPTGTIHLLDMLGRVLCTLHNSQEHATLQLGILPPGVYIVSGEQIHRAVLWLQD